MRIDGNYDALISSVDGIWFFYTVSTKVQIYNNFNF